MSTLESIPAVAVTERLSHLQASQILRGILTNNPGVKTFSVEQILASIGNDRFDVSLMMFSVPAIVPVPCEESFVTLPMGTIACQMLAGHEQIELPEFIRRKSVSRRSLAVAIHAVLPILEAAEKVVRPRWRWLGHSISHRILGLFVVLMAIAIANPLFGFNALHATSIFVIALGMAENDGLAIMAGVVAGLLSLVILGTSGVSARVLRSRASKWLRKIARKQCLSVSAKLVERLGNTWLAGVLCFEWSQLLLLWDPENPTTRHAHAAVRRKWTNSPHAAAMRRLNPARSFSAAFANLCSAPA
jgi:hypothetical protein